MVINGWSKGFLIVPTVLIVPIVPIVPADFVPYSQIDLSECIILAVISCERAILCSCGPAARKQELIVLFRIYEKTWFTRAGLSGRISTGPGRMCLMPYFWGSMYDSIVCGTKSGINYRNRDLLHCE